MSKIIYDVNQRFAVENGVPRLISTNIQVIEGGEDLMSLAISLLTQLGFYDKFEENRTSQYIGYRLKNRVKGSRRYQLVLAQRKDGLCISIPINFFDSELLELECFTTICEEDSEYGYHEFDTEITIARLWILPSKEDVFLLKHPYYAVKGEMTGKLLINDCTVDEYGDLDEIIPMSPEKFDLETYLETWADSSSYLLIQEDKLFPYAWQVSISSREVLEDFLGHFAKIIMEAK